MNDTREKDRAALRELRDKLITTMAGMTLAVIAARRLGCDPLAREMDLCRTGDRPGTSYTVLRLLDGCLDGPEQPRRRPITLMGPGPEEIQ